jgi:hypothetical protein
VVFAEASAVAGGDHRSAGEDAGAVWCGAAVLVVNAGGHGVWSLIARSFRAAHTLQMSWPTARNFAAQLVQVAHPFVADDADDALPPDDDWPLPEMSVGVVGLLLSDSLFSRGLGGGGDKSGKEFGLIALGSMPAAIV